MAFNYLTQLLMCTYSELCLIKIEMLKIIKTNRFPVSDENQQDILLVEIEESLEQYRNLPLDLHFLKSNPSSFITTGSTCSKVTVYVIHRKAWYDLYILQRHCEMLVAASPLAVATRLRAAW